MKATVVNLKKEGVGEVDLNGGDQVVDPAQILVQVVLLPLMQ